MIERGCAIVSGGTDNHLMLVDLRPKGVKGNAAAEALERAGITCNKNGVPFDPEKPTVTSGIRLGTPAGTTRGFGVKEFQDIGHLISDVLDGLARRRHRRRPSARSRRASPSCATGSRSTVEPGRRRAPAACRYLRHRIEQARTNIVAVPGCRPLRRRGTCRSRKAQPRMASGSPSGSSLRQRGWTAHRAASR